MMSEIFTSEFFSGNRARLRELFTGTAPIVVTANGLLQKSNDETFPYRQDANFWYLTGIDAPNITLVLDKDKEYLIVPELSDYQHIFDGSTTDETMSQLSGVKTILHDSEGWKQLGGRIKRVKHVATLAASPAFVETYGMYTNPARARLIRKLQAINPAIEVLDLREHLARMRVVKQPPEIVAITQAVNITCKAFQKIQKRIYENEYQLEADLSQLFRRSGASGHAYSPIVAAGINACVLHYSQNQSPIKNNQLILVDAGAQYDHYAADISRTWSFGKLTSRQRAVVAAVNEAVDFGLSQLRPGVAFWDCEQNVRQFIGEKLRELGLVKSISKASVARYYPHAPHYLGLDVHDAGDYHALMEPGMVMTIEPGIYIPEEGIGVRIEDDILITADGHKNLSATLAREL
jgi:Xaa-Pro aminopeptidase